MATPQEIRTAKFAQKLVKNLRSRHFNAFFCATADEAVARVLELIPAGSSVTWGGSATIRDMGLVKALSDAGCYDVWDRDLLTTADEKAALYRRSFSADVYLSSVNAMSEDGVLVNIDGNGNRVAAITFGPKQVIFVVGINKVSGTVDAALTRARSTAAPLNSQRFDLQTPCAADGSCHNCHSEDCICNYVHFLRNSPGGRHTVVLVGQDLGY